MEFTIIIINESNYKKVLAELEARAKNKVYNYEYGIYRGCAVADILDLKGQYELKTPFFWVQNNGEMFDGKYCSEVKTNANILKVQEHWMRTNYLENGPEQANIWGITYKPYILISFGELGLVLYEGDAVEFTDTGFNLLIDKNNLGDFSARYEFRLLTEITDIESESLQAWNDYLEDEAARYEEEHNERMLAEEYDCSYEDDEDAIMQAGGYFED